MYYDLLNSNRLINPLSPPPTYLMVEHTICNLAIIIGIITMVLLIFRLRIIQKITAIESIIFGGIGIYISLYNVLGIKSDQGLFMAVIPFLGLIMALVYIKKSFRYRWIAITGLILCFISIIMDIYFLLNFPTPVWITVLTVLLPLSALLIAFRNDLKKLLQRG